MRSKIFGTDGVRGKANVWPMTPDMVLRLGQAAGQHFKRSGRSNSVVIGKDTRVSCYMIETALTAGFASVGMDVILTGPLPTPAIGMLTRSLRADLGVMISASHNPFEDNGIKFFGPDGFKLCDAEEDAIEALSGLCNQLVEAAFIGRARRIDGAAERYIEYAKRALPRDIRLGGLKVVVDAANGAAFRTAPHLIWELGAEVIQLGTEPNGLNINDKCGSTAPEACRAKVLEVGADIGIALDGDADRVILIDEKGKVTDGDQLMALISERMKSQDRLAGSTLVATIMSNMGLERHLADLGIAMDRTKVGDRYVVERMRAKGYNLGGEQSGHIVMGDLTTTGDGLIAGLQALASMVETGAPASEVLTRFEPLPQVALDIPVDRGSTPLERPTVSAAISEIKAALGSTGRIVVRASGTQPLVRVMAEGDDLGLLEKVTRELDQVIRAETALQKVDQSWASEINSVQRRRAVDVLPALT